MALRIKAKHVKNETFLFKQKIRSIQRKGKIFQLMIKNTGVILHHEMDTRFPTIYKRHILNYITAW